MRTPPRPPPRASCIFFRASSLSSRFNFQAPSIDVRGFTAAAGSGGRVSGDDGGWGCAAGNGPAGACALALAAQLVPTITKPAATQIRKYLEFIWINHLSRTVSRHPHFP
jgi:hypothetical protein